MAYTLQNLIEYENKFNQILKENCDHECETIKSILSKIFVKYGILAPEEQSIKLDLSNLNMQDLSSTYSQSPEDLAQSIEILRGISNQNIVDIKNLAGQSVDTHSIENSQIDPEIIHSLKFSLYISKDANQALDTASNKWSIPKDSLIHSFQVTEGVSIFEYQSLLNEGLWDKVKTKIGTTGSKIDAEKNIADQKEADIFYQSWIRKVGNNQKLNTKANLTNFLSMAKNAHPQSTQRTIKQYLATFKAPGYIPTNKLHQFFLDWVRNDKLLMATKPIATATKPNAPATKFKPSPAPQPSSLSVAQALAKTPDNLKAQAILDALPNLSDADVKKIAASILSSKKP